VRKQPGLLRERIEERKTESVTVQSLECNSLVAPLCSGFYTLATQSLPRREIKTAMSADGAFNLLSDTATRRKVATNETIVVLSRGIPQGESLSKILRNAGYGIALTSEVLTGLALPLADMRVAVFVNSWPYWRIEQICEICSAFRLTAPTLPLVVVGPNDVEAKVKLFGLGVDDYVVESFDQKEFLARIKSIIRRRGCPTL